MKLQNSKTIKKNLSTMIKRYVLKLLFPLCLLLLQIMPALGQTPIPVSGRVVDSETGEGLPGVAIIERSTDNGLTVTDENGNFSVNLSQPGSLIFRFLGYEEVISRFNKAVSGTSIEMSPSYNTLDQAVVVGYQTRTRETVTGAVTVVSGDELKDAPVSSVQELLQGKVAGLNIQNNTGAPGFRGTVSIRGISQLNISGSGNEAYLQSNNPLLVIDNVPVDFEGGVTQDMLQPGAATGPLSMIPPDDIESIEILKDAQATALYGSRGANGVIVVTTRRGNSPVPRININSAVFLDLPPALHPTWGGGLERDYRVRAILNNSRSPEAARDLLSQLPILTDSLNPFYNNSTDWQTLFFQQTVNTQTNLQVSGGNPQLNYKANLGYNMQQGIIKNTGSSKYSLNMQLNMQPSPRLRINTQLFSALEQKQRGNGGGLTGNGVGNQFLSSLYPSPSYFASSPQFEGYENNLDDNNAVNIRGSLDAEYELIPGMRLTSITSYDYWTDTRDQFRPAFVNNNKTYLYGFLARRDELNSRNGISYNFSTTPDDLDQGHNILANVFTEINIRTVEDHFREMSNGPSDFYWGPRGYSPRFYPGNDWDDPDGTNTNGVQTTFRRHALSFAGMLSYNYKTKYVVDLSYRLDGNSESGIDAKYAVNPSIGLRWNFFKEPWLQSLHWLDYGSLRLSYGKNSRPTASLANSVGLYTVYGRNYNNSTAVVPDFGLQANPYIETEKSMQYNFGAELGFLQGKIQLTYDTYYKETYDIVREMPLPSETGFNNVVLNGASIANFGHELMINLRPITSTDSRGFNWSINLNGALNDGVLLKLPKDLPLYIHNEGAPFYQEVAFQVGNNPIANFIYETQGVYPSTSDVPVDPVRGIRYKAFKGNNVNFFQGGDPIWKDLNGDYALDDADDNIITGNPDPRFTGGVGTTLQYKGFSLNVFASYLKKRTLLNNAMSDRLYQMRYLSDIANTNESRGNMYDLDRLDIWEREGDIAKYPSYANYWHMEQTIPYRRDQTLFQEDGSYFKINQVTLSYTVNPEADLMRKFDIKLFRAFVTAYNLAMITGYQGANPETVSALGRDDRTAYPAALRFSLGVAMEF